MPFYCVRGAVGLPLFSPASLVCKWLMIFRYPIFPAVALSSLWSTLGLMSSERTSTSPFVFCSEPRLTGLKPEIEKCWLLLTPDKVDGFDGFPFCL